jgi:hypothetical protein
MKGQLDPRLALKINNLTGVRGIGIGQISAPRRATYQPRGPLSYGHVLTTLHLGECNAVFFFFFFRNGTCKIPYLMDEDAPYSSTELRHVTAYESHSQTTSIIPSLPRVSVCALICHVGVRAVWLGWIPLEQKCQI